jgi:predicted O-methyltransferase YrrM
MSYWFKILANSVTESRPVCVEPSSSHILQARQKWCWYDYNQSINYLLGIINAINVPEMISKSLLDIYIYIYLG